MKCHFAREVWSIDESDGLSSKGEERVGAASENQPHSLRNEEDFVRVGIFDFRAGSVTTHVGHLVWRIRTAHETWLARNRHSVRVVAFCGRMGRFSWC